MADIVFIKPDGGEINLRQREPLISCEKAEQVQELLGQDIVTMNVVTAEPVEFNMGGSVLIFGKTYTLNQLPIAEKKGERHFVYDLTFEGVQYELRRPVYFNTDISGFNTTPDFPLTGNVEQFIDVIIYNANRVFGAGKWIKGVVPDITDKTITFTENNCLAALQQICQEFNQEFDIVQAGSTRILNIRKSGEVLGHIYEYGRGNGLYTLKRQTVTDADIITRLYPFGSTKNLKPGYRDFSQRLTIAAPGYLEDAGAIATYGLFEKTVVYEDIYPKRIGAVSGVSSLLSFSDGSMTFDLNAKDGAGNTLYLVAGNSAKIHFNTGNLAGYEFEVSKYNHATKTFTLIQQEDPRGLLLPNAESTAFQFSVGDQFVIIDIMLPDSDVEVAENELNARGQLWLDQNKAPQVQYALDVDEMYLQSVYGSGAIVNVFSIGDYLQIQDADLNIDKSSRIISMRRDILHPYKYSLTIDDVYQVNIQKIIIETQKEVKTIIKTGNLKDPNRLRMGWMTTQELLRKIFDTDGYFDGGKIKPETVETLALVVGAKSQQFVLQDIIFQPNFEGNINVVAVSAGLLVHYAIAETIKTWFIEETLVTIPDNSSRYIYAKVSKTNEDEGYIIFSEDQILPDSDPSYYHFLVGLLHTAIDGVRWISLTYGATAINGRFIKTGRIQSFDGRTYFDLDLGVIGGYIKFWDSNGNMRDLSDIGADMEGFYKATILNPPDTYPNGKVTAWFQATAPDTWPTADNPLHEGDTWYKSNTGSVWRFVAGDWIPESDPDVIKQYRSTYVRVGNNKHIQIFTAEPVPGYGENDLWMSDEGLRRSINDKVTGQSFDINDWVEPFNFDNTETAINGGIITSGIIQLAGDNHSVLAGISGKGTSDSSIRFWAGTSTINRDTAPFRVDQGGQIFARKRIEVEGLASDGITYEGQAGLAGQVDELDGQIRGWAGSDYEGRNTAPFRYDKSGYVWMKRALIGNWRLDASGGFFNDSGDASIITRSGTTDGYTEAMIGPNIFSAVYGGVFKGASIFRANEINPGGNNYGAIFEATGASPGILGENGHNYAFTATHGASLIGESLLNGAKTKVINNSPGNLVYVDPTLYDFIVLNVSGSGSFLTLIKEVFNTYPGSTGGAEYANQLKDGNTISILGINDTHSFRIYRTLRKTESSNLEVNGGSITTLRYYQAAWYVQSQFDNNYN